MTLREKIYELINISDAEWTIYEKGLSRKAILKRSSLVTIGQPANHVFFVESGLLRTSVIRSEGQDKTLFFNQKGDFICDYEHFLRGLPSRFSIEAIEDSVVWLMPLSTLQAGFYQLKEGEKLGRLIAEHNLFLLSERLADGYLHSPAQRYEKFCLDYPDLLHRIPLHLIASYLNITAVHLSRLRKKNASH